MKDHHPVAVYNDKRESVDHPVGCLCSLIVFLPGRRLPRHSMAYFGTETKIINLTISGVRAVAWVYCSLVSHFMCLKCSSSPLVAVLDFASGSASLKVNFSSGGPKEKVYPVLEANQAKNSSLVFRYRTALLYRELYWPNLFSWMRTTGSITEHGHVYLILAILLVDGDSEMLVGSDHCWLSSVGLAV